MWLFDYYVHLYLKMKFMGPASMIARGAEMEKYMKMYSLNGIKTICKQ